MDLFEILTWHNLENCLVVTRPLRVISTHPIALASFPGPARSSLGVRNLHRGPGLVHHVMKTLGSARAQAAMRSWIVDVYIQIPWPHHITRSNLDFGSSSSSTGVDYCSLSYTRDLFQVLPTPFVVISAI